MQKLSDYCFLPLLQSGNHWKSWTQIFISQWSPRPRLLYQWLEGQLTQSMFISRFIIKYTIIFRYYGAKLNSLHMSLTGMEHTLHFFTLHYHTLHYHTLHFITLQYITFHYIKLHYITLHYITIHYTTLHYITLLYIRLH